MASSDTTGSHQQTYVRFVRANARFLTFGFLLSLGSSFGQTFFVSLFGAEIRTDFALTHAEFGGFYSAATLISGFALIWIGKRIDEIYLPRYASYVTVGLALSCLLLAVTSQVALLVVAFVGLRLCGQGLMTHTSVTSMARYFQRDRGKAMSVASLGLPVGEGLLPLVAVGLVGLIGWRETWAVSAAVLLLLFWPAVLWTLRQHRDRDQVLAAQLAADEAAAKDNPAAPRQRQWTRAQVMRDPAFYMLLIGVIASPMLFTGTFFHQAHMAAEKGWQLTALAAAFFAFAAAKIGAALVVGTWVDRWGAARVLPWIMPPLVAGLVVLGLVDHWIAAFIYMGLAGVNVGAMVASVGALWAERYGVRHVGAIRALVTAAMMFSTALSPVGMGALIDLGVSMSAIALGGAAYGGFAMMLLFWVLRRR